MHRIVVVLPAPFGPRNPVTRPGSMLNVSPSTAVLSPYRLVRLCTSIMKTVLSLVCEPHSGRARGSAASAEVMIPAYSCRVTGAAELMKTGESLQVNAVNPGRPNEDHQHAPAYPAAHHGAH